MLELAEVGIEGRGRCVHQLRLTRRDKMYDKFSRFLNIAQGILQAPVSLQGNVDHERRWFIADDLEKAERCQIADSLAGAGGNPSDRSWSDCGGQPSVGFLGAELGKIDLHGYLTVAAMAAVAGRRRGGRARRARLRGQKVVERVSEIQSRSFHM